MTERGLREARMCLHHAGEKGVYGCVCINHRGEGIELLPHTLLR